MLDPFPMVPLAKGQGLGVALLSYDGAINFGVVGDFDLLWDLDEFADDLAESLAELADAAGVELGTPRARPRHERPACRLRPPARAGGARPAARRRPPAP